MSYFGPELWKVLSRPFRLREGGELHKWVNVLGSLLDDGRESIYSIRRSWYTKYASGWVLDMRGEERGIIRWYGESDEDYRKRVDAAFLWYAAGGTVPGTKRALASIGYGDVELTERVPTWARFKLEFHFPLGKTMGQREWDVLNYVVFKIKAAHTLPWYFLNFKPDEPQKIQIKQKPGIYGEVGSHHAILWNTKRFYYLDGTLTLNGSITLGDGWCEAIYLNGMRFLNGEMLLDGFTAVEDDGWRWLGNPLHRSSIFAEVKRKGPFANQLYWLDGKEKLNGSLLLDAIKTTNTNMAHHKTYIEIFENGVSQGKVEIEEMAGTALMVVTTKKVREKLAKAIGETGRIAVVKYLAFGIGGVDGNNQPIAPSVDDNALKNEVFRLPVDNVGYPMATTVEFDVTLDRPEFNGHEISEFGIVDEDGDFVGIQTFPIITKSDLVTLKFYWDSEF